MLTGQRANVRQPAHQVSAGQLILLQCPAAAVAVGAGHKGGRAADLRRGGLGGCRVVGQQLWHEAARGPLEAVAAAAAVFCAAVAVPIGYWFILLPPA